MSLVAAPPKPASPAASVVLADGAFWPEIDVNALRNSLRLGDSITTHERLVFAIEGAIAELLLELAPWQARQEEAGATGLENVTPQGSVGGDPVGPLFWKRAVSFRAAAAVADDAIDLTATDQGSQRSEEKRGKADQYRAQSIAAVRGLLRLGAPDPLADAPAGGCSVALV